MRVRLIVNEDGLLRSFEASGHAGSVARGANLACAAATSLLRTAGKVCEERRIVVEARAARRGTMSCVLAPRSAADAGWLRGVTSFLVRGLRDLRDEFPEELMLDVIEAAPGEATGMPPGAAAGMPPGAAGEV